MGRLSYCGVDPIQQGAIEDVAGRNSFMVVEDAGVNCGSLTCMYCTMSNCGAVNVSGESRFLNCDVVGRRNSTYSTVSMRFESDYKG